MAGAWRWQGWRQELEQFILGWRELPDNALWLLSARQAAAVRRREWPRQRLLAGVALFVLSAAYLAICVFVYYTNQQSQVLMHPSFPPTPVQLYVYVDILVYGFVGPLALIYLLLTMGRVALHTQQWLGKDRSDAKRLQLSMLDSSVCLTALGPRDVVLAALREQLPQVWRASAAACLATVFTVLAINLSDHRSVDFATVLLLSPLTLASYALVAALGGCAVVLLMFTLGLNSATQGQRSFPALLFVFHQFAALWMGLAPLAASELLGAQRGLNPLAAVLGSLLLVGALWLGAQLALHVGRLSTTWLLILPLALTFGYWLLVAALQLSQMFTGAGSDGVGFLAATGLHLTSAWSGLSLFHSGAFVTGQSFGMGSSDNLLQVEHLFRYPLIVLTQLAQLAVLYPAALEAAALRLRALD